jgi:hypothetical protein
MRRWKWLKGRIGSAAQFPGLSVKRGTGFEPATFSLGNQARAAWIGRLGVTLRNGYRWEPLEPATARWSLARNWRARDPQFRVLGSVHLPDFKR